MQNGPEARAQTQKGLDIKSDEPKPVRFRVLVDPATSLLKQCEEAGFVLNLDPLKIGEWEGKKVKTDEELKPYFVEISDGSEAEGKTWEKAINGMGKEQRTTTVFEGIALVKDHPEILDKRRIVLPATSCGIYEIVQIEKKDGKVVISPLFVGDTNTDHIAKNGRPATKLPFAVLFATREQSPAKSA